MTLLGGKFVFPEGALVALTGSDFGASIPMYTATVIVPGGRLDVGPTRTGARCYLCVHGGIATKPLLGSASTHILTGLGGFDGRPLKKGDVLPVGPAHEVRPKTIVPDALAKLQPRKVLRATIAPQTAWFSEDSVRLFYQSAWQVTEESNRMGLRLDGPELETPHHGHMISEGVSLGAIQIPAGGRPIILFVEQQTTGGYPKIANIVSADLSSVGQLRPRDQIRFEPVTPETARELIREQEELLRSGVLFS
jgi:antagonist of KipI